MMKSPKVSIIVPCYGVQKYLDRCVESLVHQTLVDIEIILVDDKSPDDVPAMCDNWAGKDSRVKVIHKAINEGLGYARNTGLEVATGEYIAFVDSDDYVDTDMYRKLYEAALSDAADAVFCGFKSENAKLEWVCSNEVAEKAVWQQNHVQTFMLDMVACDASIAQERKYAMSVWHALYRSSIIKNNNLLFMSEREVASEDIPFQIVFLSKAGKVVYIPDELYYYCNNGSSLTATFKAEKFHRFIKLYGVLSTLLSSFPEGKTRAARFFLGYTRSQFKNLFASDYPKYAHIKEIVNDPIWEEIRIHYPINSVCNKYQKLIYALILKKASLLLYLLYGAASSRVIGNR